MTSLSPHFTRSKHLKPSLKSCLVVFSLHTRRCLLVCVFVCVFVCLLACSFVCLSVCLSVCLFACLLVKLVCSVVCLCACLFAKTCLGNHSKPPPSSVPVGCTQWWKRHRRTPHFPAMNLQSTYPSKKTVRQTHGMINVSWFMASQPTPLTYPPQK